jgi:hypothetical protein
MFTKTATASTIRRDAPDDAAGPCAFRRLALCSCGSGDALQWLASPQAAKQVVK